MTMNQGAGIIFRFGVSCEDLDLDRECEANDVTAYFLKSNCNSLTPCAVHSVDLSE